MIFSVVNVPQEDVFPHEVPRSHESYVKIDENLCYFLYQIDRNDYVEHRPYRLTSE